MQTSEGSDSPLLDLYLKQREGLLADLRQCSPVKAADYVGRFVRNLERLYVDLPTITDLQARLVPHILNVIAAGASMITAITATATVLPSGVSQLASQESRLSPLRLAVRYLQRVTAACVIAAIVMVFLSTPALIPVVLLLVIGFFAAYGAAIVRFRLDHDPFLPLLPEPQVHLSLAINTIDGKLSTSLRAADDLLALVSQIPTGSPALESDRVFELLQALCAHQTTPLPDKTIDELAKDALRLLYAARVTLVDYRPECDHLFNKQPAGITARRTLLPALVSDEGTLIRKGILLIPVT